MRAIFGGRKFMIKNFIENQFITKVS